MPVGVAPFLLCCPLANIISSNFRICMSRNCFFHQKLRGCFSNSFNQYKGSQADIAWTGIHWTWHSMQWCYWQSCFCASNGLNVIRIHKCGFGTLKTVSSLGLAFYVHDLVKVNSRWIMIRIRIKRPGYTYIYVEYFSLVKDRKKMSKRVVLEFGMKGRRGKNSMQRQHPGKIYIYIYTPSVIKPNSFFTSVTLSSF